MTDAPSTACPFSSGGTLMPLSYATASLTPSSAYRALRERHGDVAPVELEPGVPAWLVMGYYEILTITSQEQLYSRDARNWRLLRDGTVRADSGLGPMMFWRPNVIGADREEHRRLRRPLDDGVASIDQRAMRRSVESICHSLIDQFAPRGSADLVAEYAQTIPLLAIAAEFGLDPDERHELLLALAALFGSADDSQAGNRRFEQILDDVLQAHRGAPQQDLTTGFIDHPDLRNDAERLQSMVVMISAGLETTTIWISRTLHTLLTDERFGGRLRGGRLGVDDALDEVLWRDPPMANMPARYALRNAELGGQYIREGDALILGLAAANDDPRVHTSDPFLELGNRAHLAWSAGPHACPARTPARIIAHTAVDTILRRLPGLALTVEADQIAPRPSPWTRCPTALPVRFPVPI